MWSCLLGSPSSLYLGGGGFILGREMSLIISGFVISSTVSMYSRYAVSVIWKLDKQCQVKNVWYGRTLIRSRYKLAYEVGLVGHKYIWAHAGT